MVEVCKASGVNFALMCTYTVDMAMEELYNDRLITKSGKYSDGVYFQLNSDEQKLVNDKAEEICITTRLLSLAADKKFSASK